MQRVLPFEKLDSQLSPFSTKILLKTFQVHFSSGELESSVKHKVTGNVLTFDMNNNITNNRVEALKEQINSQIFAVR